MDKTGVDEPEDARDDWEELEVSFLVGSRGRVGAAALARV